MKTTFKSIAGKTIACFVCLVAALSMQAQDTIHFTNGVVKAVKLIEISPQQVSYYYFDNLNGPTHISDRQDISRIRYQNGQTDSFSSTQETPPVSSGRLNEAIAEPMLPVKPKRVKKQPLLMIFAGGGLGLGASSLEHGQMRTIYNGDVSVVYKRFIGTFRYIKSEELQISAGLFGPEFNSLIGPIEHSQETALLLGINQYTPKFLFNVSAGCSLQDNLIRGNNLATSSSSVNYTSFTTHNTVGVPVEAQIIRHWFCFGLGAKVYANFNEVHTTGGILFSIKMGYFGF